MAVESNPERKSFHSLVLYLLPIFFHGCLRIIVLLVVLDVRLGTVVLGIEALRRVPPIV